MGLPSLKLTAKAPENGPGRKRKLVFQPSIFRCELLILRRVLTLRSSANVPFFGMMKKPWPEIKGWKGARLGHELNHLELLQDPEDPSGPCFEALINVMFQIRTGAFLRAPRKNQGKTIHLIYTVKCICCEGHYTKTTELLQPKSAIEVENFVIISHTLAQANVWYPSWCNQSLDSAKSHENAVLLRSSQTPTKWKDVHLILQLNRGNASHISQQSGFFRAPSKRWGFP